MKKIILSVAVATMALSTAAAALEDIKVNGQAKLWYETKNSGTNELAAEKSSSGEVVFKLGMTGKQGNVGFGATFYQTSTMGLENAVVNSARGTGAGDDSNGDLYTSEMYITAPLGEKTLLKFGKQELDTPLAFTERWNATPNSFNAAVAVNNSIDNLTVIAAFVGQGNDVAVSGGNASGNTAGGEVTTSYYGGAYALGGLYKNDSLAANLWLYQIENVLGATDAVTPGNGFDGGVEVQAAWLDAATKFDNVNVKAYAAWADHSGVNADSTTALAVSASTTVSGINLFGAIADVSEGDLPIGNTATGFKKTKLPTAGVYTDGFYVAQPGSTSFKVKASGKLGTTGIALQLIDNNNDNPNATTAVVGGFTPASRETTEVDLILSQKVGDFNLKAILMDRSFKDNATDGTTGGQYVRVIASVNF